MSGNPNQAEPHADESSIDSLRIAHELQMIEGWRGEKFDETQSAEELIQSLQKQLDNHPYFAEYMRVFSVISVFRNNFVRVIEQIVKENLIKGVVLREVQREALIGLIQSLGKEEFNRSYIDLPTGGGKTMIIGALARACLENMSEKDAILVLTSGKNLVDQMAGKKEKKTTEEEDDEEEELEMGDIRLAVNGRLKDDDIRLLHSEVDPKERGKRGRLTVMTYAGLTEETKGKYFRDKKVRLIILDECHKGTTKRVQDLINYYFPEAIVIGDSATPHGPRRQAEEYFEHCAYRKSLRQMIEEGKAPSVRVIRFRTGLDMSNVAVTGGDNYDPQQLDQFLRTHVEERNESIVNKFLESADPDGLIKPLRQRQTITFTRSVTEAEDMAGRFNRCRVAAAVVTGKTPKKEYDDLVEKFKNREIQMLVSCKKLGEGFDAANAEAVVMARPIGRGSGWMYKQFIGRGLRLDPNNPDKDLMIVDCVDTHTTHLPFSAHEALGELNYLEGALVVPSALRDLEIRLKVMRKEGLEWESIGQRLTEGEINLLPRLILDQELLKQIIPQVIDLTEKIQTMRGEKKEWEEIGGELTEEDLRWIRLVISGKEILERILLLPRIADLSRKIDNWRHKEETWEEIGDKLTQGEKQLIPLIISDPDIIDRILNPERAERGGEEADTVTLVTEVLEEVRERILAEMDPEQERAYFIRLLQEQGIMYKEDLEEIFKNKFLNMQFPGGISGYTLGGKILGRRITSHKNGPTSFTMTELAEASGLPSRYGEKKPNEEEKRKKEGESYQNILKEQGIMYREDLEEMAKTKFSEISFSGGMSGIILGGKILRRTITRHKNGPTSFTMTELAEASGLPSRYGEKKLNEKEKRKKELESYQNLLKKAGINYQEDLEEMSKCKFLEMQFPGETSGHILGKKILRKRITKNKDCPTSFTMEELAEASELPSRNEEKKSD